MRHPFAMLQAKVEPRKVTMIIDCFAKHRRDGKRMPASSRFRYRRTIPEPYEFNCAEELAERVRNFYAITRVLNARVIYLKGSVRT